MNQQRLPRRYGWHALRRRYTATQAILIGLALVLVFFWVPLGLLIWWAAR